MPDIHREIIDHPSAWRASDFASADDYSFDLEPRHMGDFIKEFAAHVTLGNELVVLLQLRLRCAQLSTQAFSLVGFFR